MNDSAAAGVRPGVACEEEMVMAKQAVRNSDANPGGISSRGADENRADERERDRPTEPGSPDTTSESMGSEPSEADIRMRAYQRFIDRGGAHGQDFDDWLGAENDLKRSGR